MDVPGWGPDRINATYFLGGYTKYPGGGPCGLARRVTEETLGVPIAHVALIKMDGLARLIDAIGGVTVTLDCPLYEQTPDPKNPDRLLNWSLPAGEVLLDGANAKKFVTYRYLQSDFGRVRRQQQLIWAIRNQATKIDLIPRIPELWKAFASAFETDLNLLDVIGLARFGLELKPENIRGTALDHDVVKSYVTSAARRCWSSKIPHPWPPGWRRCLPANRWRTWARARPASALPRRSAFLPDLGCHEVSAWFEQANTPIEDEGTWDGCVHLPARKNA